MILEHLNTSGVQQARREDRISFTALTRGSGDLISTEGRYVEGDTDTGTERRPGSIGLDKPDGFVVIVLLYRQLPHG